MLLYRPSSAHSSWTITRPKPEAKESWRQLDEQSVQKVKEGLPSNWADEVPQKLIRNAERIVKYGLYDHPELKTWYKGRISLIGDAAHSTSTVKITPIPSVCSTLSRFLQHLEQRANQTFEDIHPLPHQTQSIRFTTPTATSEALFSEYVGPIEAIIGPLWFSRTALHFMQTSKMRRS